MSSPAVAPEVSPSHPDITAGASAALRILLAEDNPVNQKLAKAILEKRGHRVTVAGDGAEAVAACAAAEFDAILMDVQMPVMDGCAAAAEIRRMDGFARSVPIIAVTARAMESDRDRCLQAGMDAYLTKPINPEQVLAKLASLGRVVLH